MEERAFGSKATGAERPHRRIRRARPTRGVAHVDGALPAGRQPGHGAQRAVRPRGRRLHHAAAHVRRAHSDRLRLPCVRRQPAGVRSCRRRRALPACGGPAAPQRKRAGRAPGADVVGSHAPYRLPVHRAGSVGAEPAHQAAVPHLAVAVPRPRGAGHRGRPGVQPPDGLRRGGVARRAGARAALPRRGDGRQVASGDRGRPGRGHGGGVPRPARAHGAGRSAVVFAGRRRVAHASPRRELASDEARVQPVPGAAARHAGARGRHGAAANPRRRRPAGFGRAQRAHRTRERRGCATGAARRRGSSPWWVPRAWIIPRLYRRCASRARRWRTCKRHGRRRVLRRL